MSLGPFLNFHATKCPDYPSNRCKEQKKSENKSILYLENNLVLRNGEDMTQLIKRAKNGDAEAFIQLMEDNKESMKRIAFAYLKREEDVADAIQDTILDAFEHIHKLKKPEYFKTWLIRILLNNCTEIYRRNKGQTTYDMSAEEYESYSSRGGFSSLEAQSDLEFQDLLAHLPEDSRIIFQLYFGEQYTVSQIAKITKLNENTVKSRLHRGKEQLRKWV